MAAPLRVIVLGAGVESLACACELAIQGAAVTIIQPSQSRQHVIRLGRFSFDLRETVITRPDALQSLFTRAGRAMEDYLALVEIDPFIRFWFDDGVMVNFRRDAGLFARQIDQQFPLNHQGANFCNVVLARRAGEHAKVPQLMSSITESHVLRICQATHAVWEVDAIDRGMWYTFGGVRQVAIALERLAAELAVKFITSDKVETGSDASPPGSLRVDGSLTEADAVIDRRDARFQDDPYAGQPRQVLLLGINRRYPHLAHHNAFIGPDWAISLSAPCGLDPAHAPVGGEALHLELFFPPHKITNPPRHVFDCLKKFGMEDLEKRIVSRHMFEVGNAVTSSDAGLAASRGIAAAQGVIADPAASAHAIGANRVGAGA